MIMKQDDDNLHYQQDGLIDPDPYSIILGVTAFLGSVAFIATYIELQRDKQRRAFEKYERDRQLKIAFEVRDLLLAVEVDILQIETSLKKLEMLLEQGVSELHNNHYSKYELRFGTMKPMFIRPGFDKFDEDLIEVNKLVGKSFENISKITQKLYQVDVSFGEYLYKKLIELQNFLNEFIRTSYNYEKGFERLYKIVDLTQEITRDLRLTVAKSQY